MLYEFITMHHNDIVARARERVRRRPRPAVSSPELEHGVPLLLTQLSDTLRLEGQRPRLRRTPSAPPPHVTVPKRFTIDLP